MLLSRDEMTFDFGGARLDPVRDRTLLGWIMNQFLYGEVTGIQVGHWIYEAPDLEAARFLARQAVEEFQHVDNFLRILGMLGCRPEPPSRMVRFLATGMMAGSWAEHVAMEMALGEGFVLMAFYGVIDTLDHPGTLEILRRAVKQEERHVEFGERQTRKLISARPALRRRLLGLALVWMWGVRRIAGYLASRVPAQHPVLSQLPRFLDQALACAELRLRRIGILDVPIAELSAARRAALIGEAYAAKLAFGVGRVLTWPLRLIGVGRKRRLTETYLDDPAIRAALPPAEAMAATDEAGGVP